MSRKRAHMADETIDGILFGWSLEAKFGKQMAERRAKRAEQMLADHSLIQSYSHAELCAALVQYYPAYLPELLARHDIGMIRDRVVNTLQSEKDRPALLAAITAQGMEAREGGDAVAAPCEARQPGQRS